MRDVTITVRPTHADIVRGVVGRLPPATRDRIAVVEGEPDPTGMLKLGPRPFIVRGSDSLGRARKDGLFAALHAAFPFR